MLQNADSNSLNQTRKTGKSRASQKNNTALSIFKDETDVLSQKSLLKPIKFGHDEIFDDSLCEGQASSRKSCTERWFSKIEPGSMRASILTVVSSMIGVGFLTLPAVGQSSGYIPCAVFIILAAFLSLFANLQLGIAHKITGLNNYALIVDSILGKFWALVTLVFIFLYVIASSTSYFMFGGLFTYAALRDNGLISEESRQTFMSLFMVVAFIASFIGSIPEKLTALRYATLVSSLIVLYICCVIVADFFQLRDYYCEMNHPTFHLFKIDISLFSSYCLSLFSVVNQFSVVNIVSELRNPTKARIVKVIKRSAIFPLFIYLVIGLLGYATYGNFTPAVIVERKKMPGTLDIPMTIGRVLLAVCLFTGIVIRSNSNATNLCSIVWQIKMLNAKFTGVKCCEESGKKFAVVEVSGLPTNTKETQESKTPLNAENRLPTIYNGPLDDIDEEDEDEYIVPEPTPKMRTLYRFLMGLIPAILASF
jgi:hypothetical protein